MCVADSYVYISRSLKLRGKSCRPCSPCIAAVAVCSPNPRTLTEMEYGVES